MVLRWSRTRYGEALAAFLGLAVLASLFAAHYVSRERFVHFWDGSNYWIKYRDLTPNLAMHPIATLESVIDSIRRDDYNPLPVLPLVPFGWVFGTSRAPYILAVVNLYLLPAALTIGFLAQRVVQPCCSRRSLAPVLLASVSVLMLPMLWAPTLWGFPDAAGLVLIGGILLLHFTKPLVEETTPTLIATGLLLCLLVLLRRWYAFWAAAFFPSLAVAHGFEVYQRCGIGWRHYLLPARNILIIGFSFTAALFGFAYPFALRAVQTDYADIYSAYRSHGVFAEAARLLDGFGRVESIACLAGLAWTAVRKETRVLGTFLIVQLGTAFVLFARTQDFGLQHIYLLIPSIGVGIAVAVAGLWGRLADRVWRAASVGLVLAALGVSFVSAFVPEALRMSDHLGQVVPSLHFYPPVRNDIDVLENLLTRVGELERQQPGALYVLASSAVLNSSILQNACDLGARLRFFCKQILDANDVDKRDGFPRQFLQARYVVAASPTQYTLGPEDQRVVGVLTRDVLGGSGIGASFQRLPDRFALDDGVAAWIYAKVRPFERSDLDKLEDELKRYYPDRHDLFSVP